MSRAGEAWLIDWINYQVSELSLNQIVLATGPTGSGKSWSMLRLAQQTDPTFDINRVCFPAESYLSTVIDKKLPQEVAVMWDEIGVAMPARKWWDVVNQSVGYVMQSFRFKRVKSYLTLADPSMIDSIPRRLYHVHLSFYPRQGKDAPAVARIYLMSHDTRSGKPYYHFPVVQIPGRGPAKIEEVTFQKPTEDLIAAYQPKKEDYLYELWNDLLNKVRGVGLDGGRIDEGKVQLLLAFDRAGTALHWTQEVKARELGIRRETYYRQLGRAKQVAEALAAVRDEPKKSEEIAPEPEMRD